jgi:ribosomal protein L37E
MMDGVSEDRFPYDLGPVYEPPGGFRNVFKRTPAWWYLDWTVEADGYRLVIENGAMTGLACDDGVPRCLAPGELTARPDAAPPPGLPYKFAGMTPLLVSDDGAHFREAPFTCPRCGMTSYNPNDIREGYCGNCHDWTGRPARMSE